MADHDQSVASAIRGGMDIELNEVMEPVGPLAVPVALEDHDDVNMNDADIQVEILSQQLGQPSTSGPTEGNDADIQEEVLSQQLGQPSTSTEENDDPADLSIMSIDVDEVSTVQTSTNEGGIDEVEIFEDNKGNNVEPLGYIRDPTTRRKRFFARKKTLIEKAKEIHTLCGSKVVLRLEAESGRQHIYLSHPILQRSVKMQAGASQLEKRQSNRPIYSNTPTKRRPQPLTTPVQGLPGKRHKQLSKKAKEHPQTNKCKVCKIIFESKRDRNIQNKKGKQGKWMGCEIEGCDYWAHAFCLNIKVGPRQNPEDIPFKCPAHK